MNITKDTLIADILAEHGDIADVMEQTFGLTRAGDYESRQQIAKTITVEQAAEFHKVPLEALLTTLQGLTTQPATEAH